MAHIAKIIVYPIKSLDGVEVTQAKLLESGSLKYDRQYAIFDKQGKFVNAKRHVKIHLLRANFNLEYNIVSFSVVNDDDTKEEFHLKADKIALEAWLSDFFGFHVRLQENLLVGFPDDTVSPGPTIISNATIKEVTSWYENISEDQMRRRLRTTIEIDGVPAFWEDRLFSDNSSSVPFKVGNINFFGVNPCQRCIVPTRDAATGERSPNFQKIFIDKRQETLPQWVPKFRFNHFYKLSVNTKLAPGERGNKFIRVTDEVKLLN